MESIQNRSRNHRAAPHGRRRTASRDELTDPLVSPGLVEMARVLDEYLEQVTLAEHDDPGKSQKWDDVIEALTTDTPDEAFTESVRFRHSYGRFQHPRADAARDAVELAPVLVVTVSNGKPRPEPKRRGVA
jgi:hypothetical protein